MQEVDYSLLSVTNGTKISLEVTGLSDKLATGLVGFVRGKYIITLPPLVSESNKDLVYQYLYAGNTATLRYLHLGTVMGFTSEIIKYIFSPFPLFFFAYPKKIETYNLRRHKRISCLFPSIVIINKKRFPAMIIDVSVEGCSVSPIAEAGEKLQIEIEDPVVVESSAFASDEPLRMLCSVKRINSSEKKIEIGLKIHQMSEEHKVVLREYIQKAEQFL